MGDDSADTTQTGTLRHCRRRRSARMKATTTLCALLAGSLHTAMAQNNCISLADSTACPAFSAASISTNSNLTGLFPFLSSVDDVSSFDSELRSYVDGAFAQLRCVQYDKHRDWRILIPPQIRPVNRLFEFQFRQHHGLLRALFDKCIV